MIRRNQDTLASKPPQEGKVPAEEQDWRKQGDGIPYAPAKWQGVHLNSLKVWDWEDNFSDGHYDGWQIDPLEASAPHICWGSPEAKWRTDNPEIKSSRKEWLSHTCRHALKALTKAVGWSRVPSSFTFVLQKLKWRNWRNFTFAFKSEGQNWSIFLRRPVVVICATSNDLVYISIHKTFFPGKLNYFLLITNFSKP